MEAEDYVVYTLFNCSPTLEENTIDEIIVSRMAAEAKWARAAEIGLYPLIARIVFPYLVNGVDKEDLGVLVSNTLRPSILLSERARDRRVGIIGPIQRTAIDNLLAMYSGVERLIHKQRQEMIAHEQLLTEYRGVERTLRNIANRLPFIEPSLQAALEQLSEASEQIGSTPLLNDAEIRELSEAMTQIETILGQTGFRTYGAGLEQVAAFSSRVVSRYLHHSMRAAVIRVLRSLRVG